MSASSAAEKNTSRLLPPLYSGSGSFATKSAFVVSNTPHPIVGVFGEEQCAVRRTISKRRMNWSPTRAQKGRQNLLNSTQPNNHLSRSQRRRRRRRTHTTIMPRGRFIPPPSQLSLVLEQLNAGPRLALSGLRRVSLTLAARNDRMGAR